MAENTPLTAEQIQKAVEAVKTLRPAYTEIVDFYGQVFLAQEESKSRVRVEPDPIPGEMLSVKAREKFPLASVSDFVIDMGAAEELFERIRRMVVDGGGETGEEADKVRRALDSGDLEIRSVFASLLEQADDYLARKADELGLELELLGILAKAGVRPSLEMCAHKLSAHLDPDAGWDKGYCPICGSSPGLSVLRSQGARSLICSFCVHEWDSKRIYCPFCENSDNETLQYFYSEEEKEYRVDVCEKCKKYLKTVDLNKLDRIFHPPLEQVGTIHLDMKANELGYSNPLG